MKISETTDYKKFELYSINRDVAREKFLRRSLEQYGWIPAFPMYVVRNGNNRLKIKDGHHRFSVAKSLNIPVKYVICEENGMSIHELNKTVRSWSVNDYLNSYVKKGNPAYSYLKEYCQRAGIAVSVALPMLAGNAGGSSGAAMLNRFKDGGFDVTDDGVKTGVVVERIAKLLKDDNVDFACHKNFIGALVKVCAVAEVNQAQLINKFKKHTSVLRKQPTVDLYIKNIEDVYNRSSREVLPVSHLVNAEMKRRNAISIADNAKKGIA